MLNGKTVVVTGAARGLGRDIAIACGRHGAALILGDILEEQGLETVACLKADGVTARFVPVDLGDPESVASFGHNIAANERTVHGLVNNAAIATNVGGAKFEDIDIELWDRVMRVNVRGTWLMTRALSPPAAGRCADRQHGERYGLVGTATAACLCYEQGRGDFHDAVDGA